MHVQVLSAASAFDELQDEWLQLLAQMPFQSVFFTPQWHAVWWRHFGQDDAQLHLLTVRSETGELCGLAPLMITEADASSPRLQCIGDLDLCDYFDILIAPAQQQAVTEVLAQHIAELMDDGMAFCLSNLSCRSSTPDLLADGLSAQGLSVEMAQIETCPTIVLPDDWDTYLTLLRGKDRHEMRRKIRRAESTSTLTYSVAKDLAGLEADLETFVALHRLSREDDKRDFMNQTRAAFFRDMAHVLWHQGWFELACLQADGVPVAALCCFTYGTSFAAYNAGYHPDYSHLSVGIVLFANRIQRAITQGFACFDFLRGDERYKYRFGATDRPLQQLVARTRCPLPGARQ